MQTPKSLSKTAGYLYLVVILGLLFDEFFVRGQIVVWNDPTQTVQNILEKETLFRAGFVAHLIAQASILLMVLILYQLLKGIHTLYATVMVACIMVTVAITTLNQLNGYAALMLIKNTPGYMDTLPNSKITGTAACGFL